MLDLERLELDASPRPVDQEGCWRVDELKIQNWRVGGANWCLKRIAETLEQGFSRAIVGPYGHAAAQVQGYGPELVDAMRVIGVRMGENNAVQRAYPSCKKLLTEVGR